MALNLKVGKSAVTFEYTDDNMTAAWTVKAEDGQDKLLGTMRKVIAFVEDQDGPPALSKRTPGASLQAVREVFPAPELPPGVPAYGVPPTNGWAGAVPEIPEDRRADWEYMPKEGE
ncbi:hypothetical protein [Streptomyces rochei]|uniref:hypothetical protein n=1 Tax=Streptomyces rochei TaxID=1928 RepID=UPI0036FCA2DB